MGARSGEYAAGSLITAVEEDEEHRERLIIANTKLDNFALCACVYLITKVTTLYQIWSVVLGIEVHYSHFHITDKQLCIIIADLYMVVLMCGREVMVDEICSERQNSKEYCCSRGDAELS